MLSENDPLSILTLVIFASSRQENNEHAGKLHDDSKQHKKEVPRRKLTETDDDRFSPTTGQIASDQVVSGTASSITSRGSDQVDGGSEHSFLTTCIAPYRTYVPSNKNFFREPYGDIKVLFNGGDGSFYKQTNGTYPGYDPDLEFMFHFDLKGLRDHCKDCRIHINEGISCESPLIRFWNRSVEGAYNPWRPEYGAVYNSNKDGKAKGAFSMFDGFDFNEHKRRTVVVYDQDKNIKIGCGILRRQELGTCENGHNPDSTKSPSLSPNAKLTAVPSVNVVPPAMDKTTSPITSASPSTAAPTTMVPTIMATVSPLVIAPPASIPTDEPMMPTPLPTPSVISSESPVDNPMAMPSSSPWPHPWPIPAPFDVPYGNPTGRPHLKPHLPPDLLPPSYYPPTPTCTPENSDKDSGSSKGKAGKAGGSDKKDKRERRR
jgi:hypothetical protein